MENNGYVIVAEHKHEGPIVFETYLENSSYNDAKDKLKMFKNNPDIIRVAIFKIKYVEGNETLSKGMEND
jgi:hypothetical protein